MDLDGVDAIFQRVVLADDAGGELALLADGDEATAQCMGHSAAQDEAACFNARHIIDAAPEEGPGQLIDGGAKAVKISEQRGDVTKENAGLGIVRNGADVALDVETVAKVHDVLVVGFPDSVAVP